MQSKSIKTIGTVFCLIILMRQGMLNVFMAKYVLLPFAVQAECKRKAQSQWKYHLCMQRDRLVICIGLGEVNFVISLRGGRSWLAPQSLGY